MLSSSIEKRKKKKINWTCSYSYHRNLYTHTTFYIKVFCLFTHQIGGRVTTKNFLQGCEIITLLCLFFLYLTLSCLSYIYKRFVGLGSINFRTVWQKNKWIRHHFCILSFFSSTSFFLTLHKIYKLYSVSSIVFINKLCSNWFICFSSVENGVLTVYRIVWPYRL